MLRATEGLMRTSCAYSAPSWPCPIYGTLCRRRSLAVELPRRPKDEPLHLVVNSMGVKVYGEGEWKVRPYGYTRRCTRRKLHLAVDEATKEFVAVMVTANGFKDSQLMSDLLEQVKGEVG